MFILLCDMYLFLLRLLPVFSSLPSLSSPSWLAVLLHFPDDDAAGADHNSALALRIPTGTTSHFA